MRTACLLVLLACDDVTPAPRAPAPEPELASYEVEAFKEDPPIACPASDAGGEDAEADGGGDAGSASEVLAAIRAYVRPCYDELAARETNGQGRLVEQLWLSPSGEVCGVRTTLRVGLSREVAACVEKMLRAARFEGVSSPFYVPLGWVVKDANGRRYGHPSRLENIHTCGRAVTTATEATITYASDEAGAPGDLSVDPWSGDQKALECAAEAVRATPHAPSTQFVLKLRYHP